MKGLVLKDLLGLKKYMRTLGVIVAMYVVFGAISKSPEFICMMMVVLCAMIPMVVFSYDAMAKWDSFGLTLPVTRKEVVLSRYILAVIFMVGGMLLSLAITLLFYMGQSYDAEEAMSFVLGGSGASLLLVSVMLPIIYKFGVEKGRFVIVGFFAVIGAVGFVLSKLSIPAPSESVLVALIQWSPLLALVALVISFYISCYIFKNKEV